ncbi:ABC transporter substrate binding protein [Maridesulfovibrio sp.]|uniref:ABC transporter substrate binding protein n=1 Tax=Maridesulfovibrio sp. TaxID=2795000 RepID=UPI0029CA7A37|nr:ABC transporter substrate binding protein [Maridesulfovibrio sp.]
MRSLCLYICLTFILLMCMVLSAAAKSEGSKHVLILHSYHPGMAWVDNLDKGIREELLRPPYDDTIIHTEYMDTKRHQSQKYYDKLLHIYKEKYRNINLNLVIATDNNAFDLLLKHKNELFKNVPVVFGGVNNFSDKSIENRDDFTGVAEIVSLRETIEIIFKHFPDTKEIFVINDYLPSGRAWAESILRAQKPFEDKARFVHNENLSMEELKGKINSLKPGTVVLFGAYYTDRNGQYLASEKIGNWLTENSSMPVYCLARRYLWDNVIGGKILDSGRKHGRVVGELARRVLGGESPKNIPVVKSVNNTYIFNWLGMEKYGVSREDIPKDSVIINQPHYFYRKYQSFIWIAVAIISLLSLLVFMLFIAFIKLRRTREELSYSERKYRSIFDNAIEGMFQTTFDGDILTANPACVALFGYDSVDELTIALKGTTNNIYIDSDERKRLLYIIWQDGKVSGEVRIYHKDGHKLWLNVNARQVVDHDGKSVIEGSVVDITERKKAEAELIRMRKYLANVLDSMPSILVGVDQDVRVTMLNSTGKECSGASLDDAQGKILTELFPWLDPFVDMIKESSNEQVPRRACRVLRHQAGKARYETITAFPLDPDISKEVIVRIDNESRSVQMEQMMVQSEKMMSIGGLAAGMAHEINNPLAVVMGSAQNISNRISKDLDTNRILAEECGTTIEVINEYLDKRGILRMLNNMTDGSERAANIVGNMLTFSRKSEPSGAGLFKVTCLLDEAVGLATNFYDMQRQFDFRRVKVSRQYSTNLPDIKCDGNEMQQVFLNLLKNGAEAMTEKDYGDQVPKFILRAYLKENYVVTEIEDNGPGMPEHIRRRILEPFFTTKPVGQGTGLGLSVSYFIVTDLYKGSMEVQSEEGEWTRFIIKIPRADS